MSTPFVKHKTFGSLDIVPLQDLFAAFVTANNISRDRFISFGFDTNWNELDGNSAFYTITFSYI